MQYWINHDGVQTGPVDRSQLAEMSLTSRAYVWHEGLDDWVKITQLPDLQGLYQFVEDNDNTDNASGGAVGDAGQSPAVSPDAVHSDPLNIPPVPPVVVGEPYNPNGYVASQPYAAQQPVHPMQHQAAQQPSGEPCPPTNLVWAILATVLCCLPAGVIAILYAVKVSRRYQAGDLAGAQRASETGAWWCIASIILGIILQPLMTLMTLGAAQV